VDYLKGEEYPRDLMKVVSSRDVKLVFVIFGNATKCLIVVFGFLLITTPCGVSKRIYLSWLE
jgi:hypothetical protein